MTPRAPFTTLSIVLTAAAWLGVLALPVEPFAAGSKAGSGAVQTEDERAENRLSRDNLVELQEGLIKLGYDVGPIDGIVGPRTRAAIRQFEADHGYFETGGRADPFLLELVRINLQELRDKEVLGLDQLPVVPDLTAAEIILRQIETRSRAEKGDIEAQLSLGLWAYLDENYEQAIYWWRSVSVSAQVASAQSVEPPEELVIEVQRTLVELGYGPGPLDGFVGPRTRAAIRAFQADNGLTVTGAITERLRRQLQYFRTVKEAKELGRVLRRLRGREAKLPLEISPEDVRQFRCADRSFYPQDLRELKERAEDGDPEAQYRLGEMYEKGWCIAPDNAEMVPQDYSEALRWYRKAAEQGHAEAQYRLGMIFYWRRTPEADKEALNWFQRAAENGLPKAAWRVGEMYLKGFGIERDYVEAVNWFTRGADLGDELSQINLGSLYAQGKGFPEYERRTPQWFRHAARLERRWPGFSEIFIHDSLPKGDIEAVRWLGLAAEHGIWRAQWLLGIRYRDGRGGVPQDYIQAFRWLNLASAGNGVVARGAADARDRVAKLMTPEQIDQAQGLTRKWLAEHPDAQTR